MKKTEALERVAEDGDALDVIASEGDAACISVLGINSLDNLDQARPG